MPNHADTVAMTTYVQATVSELSEQDAEALRAWYAALAASVARFPQGDLKRVEPPLISTPR
jgi:cytochrome c553